jgi:hypothetical protein
MWESRVVCEISKRLWKSWCDFHSRVISIVASIFVSHHLLGCRKKGMLDLPALAIVVPSASCAVVVAFVDPR